MVEFPTALLNQMYTVTNKMYNVSRSATQVESQISSHRKGVPSLVDSLGVLFQITILHYVSWLDVLENK